MTGGAVYGVVANFSEGRRADVIDAEAGAQVTKDGRPVGTVTSPAASPRVGTIGLAILDADVAGDGEKVDVAVGDGTAAATVAPLSILDPKKERPRS